MRKPIWIIFVAILVNAGAVLGQKVPTYMNFADIKLKITEGAKREIQKDVDMLTRSPKHHKIKADRAKLYFPIIERTFREEGVPDDFKYLALQESALIPDAVSSSKAVGFWQFKKDAGKEMGLRIDGIVDERMNVVSASRGAARYLKKYNTLFFNNWLYMLQGYYMGPGGALRSLDKKNYGAKRMIVDKKTHWYVKRYLAHKIAFQNAVDHRGHALKLAELTHYSNENLKNIAREFSVDVEQVKDYNKWLKGKKIPDDKVYTVVIPVENNNRKLFAQVKNDSFNKPVKTTNTSNRRPSYQASKSVDYEMGMDYPKIKKKIIKKTSLSYTLINGIPGVIAKNNTTIKQMADRGGISVKKFRSYNDLGKFDKVAPGHPYYFKRKKSKARLHYYAAKPKDNLWSIAQKFGLRLDKLMQKNRLIAQKDLKPGQILWLRFIRPAEKDVEFIQLPENNPKKALYDPVKPALVIENKSDQKPITKEGTKKPESEKPKVTTIQSFKDDNKPSTLPIEKNKQTTLPPQNLEEEPEEEWSAEDTKWVEEGRSGSTQNYGSTTDINPVIERKHPGEADAFNGQSTTRFVRTDAPSATVENGKQIHVIKQGETLFSIARTYNITVNELKSWNNLDESGSIKFDQKIIVGMDHEMKETKSIAPVRDINKNIIFHEVQEGDTMSSISRTYQITIEKLMELNEKTDYNIAIGEKLKVVKSK